MSTQVSALNYLAGRMGNEHQKLWSHLGNAAWWWGTDACHIIINKWEPNRAGNTARTWELFHFTQKASSEHGVTECLAGGDPGGNGWVIQEAVRGRRVADLHCSECGPMHQQETGIFILYRGSPPPALPWLPLKAIHSHTWIRNEIISLPPRALITQPWWLDGPGHTERARKQIEKRKVWRWWTGAVEVQSFRVDYTEMCCNRASGGAEGNKGLYESLMVKKRWPSQHY